MTIPRLEKLSRGLTARERIRLYLQARNSGAESPGFSKQDFDDNAQRLLYDCYMSVLYIANSELGNLLDLIQRHVEWVASESEAFELLHAAAEKLAEDEGVPLDWRLVRRLPGGKPVSVSVYVADLSEQVRRITAERVVIRWKEFRAVEKVWQEMAEDFDGEDPVDPHLRRTAEETRMLLTRLAEGCAIKKLPEPERDVLDRTWELVDRTYKTLKLVKPEP
jgi:hypothetical protein